MIRHVVVRTFVAGLSPDQVEAIEERTRAFIEIDGVHAVVTGRNLELVPRSGGFEHVTTIDLTDAKALRAFVADPRHVAAAEVSGPLTANVVILDVSLP